MSLILLSKIKEVVKTLVISKGNLGVRRSLGATDNSRKNSKIPEEQLKIVDKEIEMLRRGNPPSVYRIAAEALNAIPGSNSLTLLDMGCASGYYSEVISTLVGKRFEYTGSDYSDAMIAIARKRYPNVRFMSLNIRHIDLPSKAFDVVLSGAVLVHVKEWKEAVRELSRITRSYLILHRTPLTDGKSYRIEKKIYAGVSAFYNTFGKDELMNLISECGFRNIFERNVYPGDKKGSDHMTYVFERVE